MDVVRWLLFGALPAAAAVLLLVGVGGARFLALALAIALCVPFALVDGWPPWPWQLSLQSGRPDLWLWWVFLAIGIVGTGYDTKLLPKPLLLAFDFLLVVSLPWLLSAPLRSGWTFEQCVLGLGAGWVVVLGGWWLQRRVAKACPGVAVPLAGAIVLAADAVVLRAMGSPSGWQLAGVAAVALGLTVATTIWRRPFRCGTGGALAITVAHVGLLGCGRTEADLLRVPFLLVLAAPLGMGLAPLRLFARRPGMGVVVGIGATLALAIVSCAIV